MHSSVELLTKIFEENRNDAEAGPMKKYMKEQFPFLGIKKPLRSKLETQFLKQSEILKGPLDREFILSLWEKEEREYQYAALTYLEKSTQKLQKQDMVLMATLITTKSWWDTVDMLAQKPVASIAFFFPEVIKGSLDKWAVSENMWLRRSAILFQLKYKDRTDENLLYEYILKNTGSKEFFIQKAIGWALREYSKTNPDSVKRFLEGHQVPALSYREGSKYLAKANK